MIALNLKGDISKFPEKTHYLDLGRSKLKVTLPVNYFPVFVGKNIKNCSPSKLFSCGTPFQPTQIAI